MKVFKKILTITFVLAFLSNSSISAAEAKWIWFPGDFDIWLSNQMHVKRTERMAHYPQFWRMDAPYPLVCFQTDFDIPQEEIAELWTQGICRVAVDGQFQYGEIDKIKLPAGKHTIQLMVFNDKTFPAAYLKSKSLVTDDTWITAYNNPEITTVDTWIFDLPDIMPDQFTLAVTPQSAVSAKPYEKGEVADFGRETFGYLKFHGVKGNGKINIFYGESTEEAQSPDACETYDIVTVNLPSKTDSTLTLSKAFRFVNIQPEAGVTYDSVSMMYEFMLLPYRGDFKCSDPLLNKIWDVSCHTLHLSSREFFIDGIKRDRWVWSGDAYQSYLMNYYLFSDNDMVKRTLWALRGKDPVNMHINHIMDYSFYWFMGIYDYYLHTGDTVFMKKIYPRMKTLMDFCLSRRNADGFMEGRPGDWVFIDWANLDNGGEVSFEQIVCCRSLEAMSICAQIMGDKENAAKYSALSKELLGKTFDTFWDKSQGAFVHSRRNGRIDPKVTRYANMFAMFMGYLDEDKTEQVRTNVLMNDNVQKITTPYMRFYELEALCAIGEYKYVLDQIRDYWGGMLDLGATSFWETYDPTQTGVEHYAMYGRDFGKSLCHAWGASPIYLFGKYYLGVKPLTPGYATWSATPNLGDLEWIEGKVPAMDGEIEIKMTRKEIYISSDTGSGELQFSSKKKPSCKEGVISPAGDNLYKLEIKPGVAYKVLYTAL